MIRTPGERLYDLLPEVYRMRDGAQGEPLRVLLGVIESELEVLEADIEQLYDNWFVETCAEWVVPYLGDLLGVRGLLPAQNGAFSQRGLVANTLAYRRGKGTAAVLEQLARDVTGWPARVVEFFELLAATQYLNHVRPGKGGTLNLRDANALELLNGPFERAAHTVDVRRISEGRGRYNIPNVGIFLWRLGAYSLTKSPAFKLVVEDENDRRYRFSPLGNDMTLFNLPETEGQITHLAEPLNVPMPITRRVLDSYLADYYGTSLQLFEGANEVPVEDVIACDLSGWVRKPKQKYAIDPVLGRIASPEKNPDGQDRDAPSDLKVTYHYGFGADMGGGEYGRNLSPYPPDAIVETVSSTSIQDALDEVSVGGFVEITDSGLYGEARNISVTTEDGRVEVRARDGHRPSIVPDGDLDISGAENTEVTLDGLLISGAALRVAAASNNKVRRLRLRHCTLVPGLGFKENGSPRSPTSPSLIVESANLSVEIEHCIVGGLHVADGNRVRITNSIVDAAESQVPSVVNINSANAAELDTLPEIGPATAESILERRRMTGLFGSVDDLIEVSGIGPATLQKIKPFATVNTAESGVAFAAPDGKGPGGTLHIANSTIIGKVHTGLMELASNSIFLSPVHCERLQQGCVRFSYLPPKSRTPRKHRCRPEDPDDQAEDILVRPQFSSLRFGDPGYCQLDPLCALEIRQGADDEAEMGAFHDLYQPQREANLRVRLEEYLRFGLEAGVFYAS
jgi:competence ComEA-like helix-hairpin-helix protein